MVREYRGRHRTALDPHGGQYRHGGHQGAPAKTGEVVDDGGLALSSTTEYERILRYLRFLHVVNYTILSESMNRKGLTSL